MRQGAPPWECGALRIDVLNPGVALTGGLNDDSLVLLLTYGTVRFLFTGDIESSTESQMVRSGLVPAVDVLKVAHHGLYTSSTVEFLSLAQPQVAIISTGGDLPPAPVVIRRLLDLKTDVYRTDTHGHVWVDVSRDAISVRYSTGSPP